MTQKTNNFDLVFEKLESAVKNNYHPGQSTSLLSSGMDCGVINCAIQKIFGEADCLADPQQEVIDILQDRVKLHRARLLPNLQGHHEEKEKIFNQLLPTNEVWDLPMINPVINLIKNGVKKRNKKIVIVGTGGDEIYNDRQGQKCGHLFSKTNGGFPASLELVWPWHNYHSQLRLMNMRFDFITGYFGIGANYPLTDVELVQAWLNTTQSLKKEYKLWMKEYMLQEKYPYTTEKVHSFNQKYEPEQWKIVNDIMSNEKLVKIAVNIENQIVIGMLGISSNQNVITLESQRTRPSASTLRNIKNLVVKLTHSRKFLGNCVQVALKSLPNLLPRLSIRRRQLPFNHPEFTNAPVAYLSPFTEHALAAVFL